eukprot:gene36488-biopygen7256
MPGSSPHAMIHAALDDLSSALRTLTDRLTGATQCTALARTESATNSLRAVINMFTPPSETVPLQRVPVSGSSAVTTPAPPLLDVDSPAPSLDNTSPIIADFIIKRLRRPHPRQHVAVVVPTELDPISSAADLRDSNSMSSASAALNLTNEVHKGMYGLPQAGLSAQERLIKHLALSGYDSVLSMPGFIDKVLERFYRGDLRQAKSPCVYVPPQYGQQLQTTTIDHTPTLPPAEITEVQGTVESLLYYAKALDSNFLQAVTALVSAQANLTESIRPDVARLLAYAASYPNNRQIFHASDMILEVRPMHLIICLVPVPAQLPAALDI